MEEFPNTRHRRNDPETSIEAAKRVNVKLCQTRVLNVIRSYGSKGCIVDDLRAELPNMSPAQRMVELERKGKIIYIGKRKGRLGRNQRIAVAVDQTSDQLELGL